MAERPGLIITINSLRSGGAERVVSQLLGYLINEYDVHLALYSRIIEYDIPKEVKVFNMDQSEDESAVNMLFKLPALAKRLAAYCNQNQIQYSVAFLNRPCYLNALMRTFYGYKGRVVMCERTHQTSMLSTKSWITRFMTRLLIPPSYNRADLVLANAEAMKKDLISTMHVSKPIRVIYNPIDLELTEEKKHAAVPLTKEAGCFYFIGVGNFRKEKNFPLLVDAFNKLSDLNCKLILVGEGPDEEKIKTMISDAGTFDKVFFTGKDRNPFRWMNIADAFVLTSDVEGFPNVLLESLACGLPSISTDCLCGPREMLAPGSGDTGSLKDKYEEHQYGILCPTGNATILSEAMKRIMQDEPMRIRLSDSGRMRAKHFELRRLAREYSNAFSGRSDYQNTKY